MMGPAPHLHLHLHPHCPAIFVSAAETEPESGETRRDKRSQSKDTRSSRTNLTVGADRNSLFIQAGSQFYPKASHSQGPSLKGICKPAVPDLL